MAARQYSRPTMPLPDMGQSSPAGLQVVAQPAESIRAPRPFDEGEQLAAALAHLNPALQKFLAQDEADKAQGRIEEGQRARAMQTDSGAVPMTPEQDPYWQKGYMLMHGQMMGIQDAAAWDEEFQNRKQEFIQNPGAFQQWMGEKKQATLAGMTDPDALKSYLPQLVGAENKMRRDIAVENVQFAREQKMTAANTYAGKVWSDTHDTDILGGVVARDEYLDAQYALGIPRRDSMNLLIKQALSDESASPMDLQTFFAPGKDGVVPANLADDKGNSYGPQIKAAMVRAQQRLDADLSTRQAQHKVEMGLWEQDLIQKGMVSQAIPDSAEYIRAQSAKGGLYDSPSAAREGFARLEKARQDEGYAQQWAAAVNGLKPLPYAIAGDPRVKPMILQQYEQNWASVDWRDPKTFNAAITRSTQMHEAWGVADPYIERVAKSVDTMGTVKDDKGVETLSPQFRAAYALYKGLKESNNPQLAQFDAKSLAFLQTFESGTGVMSELDAFRRAHKANTEEGDARAKAMFPSAQAKAAQIQQFANLLNSSVRSNGMGFWPNVENREDVARRIVDDAEASVRAGNITTADALEVAKTRNLALYVSDGYRHAVRIPPDLPREKATRYLELMSRDAKAAFETQYPGQTYQHYDVLTSTDASGKAQFVYTDPMGVPILTRNVDELEQQYLAEHKLDAQGIAQRQGEMAAQQFQSTDPTFGAIGQSRNELNGKLLRGEINPAEYQRQLRVLDAHRNAVVDREAQRRFNQGAAPEVAPPNMTNPAIKDTVPGPLGLELSPKQVATKYAAQDPTFALGAFGEGFSNVVYADSVGKRTLGIGYNLDARTPDQVKGDLRAAGVTDPGRVERVMKGEESLTPDEVQRLYSRVRPTYEKLAREAVGEGVWQELPDNRRAVLTDIAYQTGNVEQFRHALDALKSGNTTQAINEFAVNIRDPKTKQLRLDSRRNTLRQAMWESPDRFLQLVTMGT